MTTPVFDRVFSQSTFSALPNEYTDRYTPEIALQQGREAGERETRAAIASKLRKIPKPSKALLAIIAEIEGNDD